MNGVLTSRGMKTWASRPARAAYAASALPALPADGIDSDLRAQVQRARDRGGEAARLEGVGRVAATRP